MVTESTMASSATKKFPELLRIHAWPDNQPANGKFDLTGWLAMLEDSVAGDTTTKRTQEEEQKRTKPAFASDPLFIDQVLQKSFSEEPVTHLFYTRAARSLILDLSDEMFLKCFVSGAALDVFAELTGEGKSKASTGPRVRSFAEQWHRIGKRWMWDSLCFEAHMVKSDLYEQGKLGLDMFSLLYNRSWYDGFNGWFDRLLIKLDLCLLKAARKKATEAGIPSSDFADKVADHVARSQFVARASLVRAEDERMLRVGQGSGWDAVRVLVADRPDLIQSPLYHSLNARNEHVAKAILSVYEGLVAEKVLSTLAVPQLPMMKEYYSDLKSCIEQMGSVKVDAETGKESEEEAAKKLRQLGFVDAAKDVALAPFSSFAHLAVYFCMGSEIVERVVRLSAATPADRHVLLAAYDEVTAEAEAEPVGGAEKAGGGGLLSATEKGKMRTVLETAKLLAGKKWTLDEIEKDEEPDNKESVGANYCWHFRDVTKDQAEDKKIVEIVRNATIIG